MKLVPSTKFGQTIMIRIVRKILKKKLGIDADLEIGDLSIDETANPSYVCLNANFKVSLKKTDLEKLIDRI